MSVSESVSESERVSERVSERDPTECACFWEQTSLCVVCLTFFTRREKLRVVLCTQPRGWTALDAQWTPGRRSGRRRQTQNPDGCAHARLSGLESRASLCCALRVARSRETRLSARAFGSRPVCVLCV